jgi:hypothetical protein
MYLVSGEAYAAWSAGAQPVSHRDLSNTHVVATMSRGARSKGPLVFAFECPARSGTGAACCRLAEIDRIVFLVATPNLSAEKLKSRALFIVARDDASEGGRGFTKPIKATASCARSWDSFRRHNRVPGRKCNRNCCDRLTTRQIHPDALSLQGGHIPPRLTLHPHRIGW